MGLIWTRLLFEFFLTQLRHGDLAVDRAGYHQFVMCAEPGNLAAVEHEDLIGIADSADALGNDDLCRAGQLLCKPLAEHCVGLIVQRGERIVENQNFRLSCQRPCDGKPLLLPAGDVPAKLGDGVRGLFGYLSTNSAACDKESAACSDASVFSAALCPKKTLSSTVPENRTAFCVT